MAGATDTVLIYTTWPDVETAEAAGRALVAERLAACVNILAPATSIYAWEGAVARDTEHPMLIKTVAARVEAVMAAVQRQHPYDVPAIIVLGVAGGDAAFLQWIAAHTAVHAGDGLDGPDGKGSGEQKADGDG